MGQSINIDSLFRLYCKPLCVYALHYQKDKSLIEDIVQDAFMAYFTKVGTDCVIDNPKSYLFTSVKNRCIDAIRCHREKMSIEDLNEDVLPVEDGMTIPDDEAVDNSFKEARIWDAIGHLPAKRRRIFLMSRRDGMKYGDIARALGISENTVRNQISRALESIRHGIRKVVYFLLSL